jgi:deazaflavin-dependent oxidoreductase (nitroreductase family)
VENDCDRGSTPVLEIAMSAKLAGRLQQVAGRQTLRLTHYGRKSGKPYEVTIWFAVHGGTIYLPTANVGRQWVKNVRKTPRVRLAIGGEEFAGEARLLTAARERERVQALVARKYWMFLPVMAIGRLLTAVGVVRDRTGFFAVQVTAA